MVFLVAAHTLLYGVGQAGYIPFQDTGNPHKTYRDQFLEGGQAEQGAQSVAGQEQTGIIGQVTSIFLSLPIIGDISQFLFGPEILAANTGLPPLIKNLFIAILSALKFGALASFVRGVNW